MAEGSITDYFRKRESLQLKSPYEGELILGLIYLGKEEEAIAYLEQLIDDFLRGKIYYLPLGSRSADDVNLFDLLCLSERPEIAKKSLSLLYYYTALRQVLCIDYVRFPCVLRELPQSSCTILGEGQYT